MFLKFLIMKVTVTVMKEKSLGSIWAEIDLDNLEYNFKGLKNRIPGDVKMCMVLKADAYGHGSVELAKFYEMLGTDFFAVARSSEGVQLRRNGIKKPVLNLGVTDENDYMSSIENDISMTVFSYETARFLDDIAKSLNKKAKIHIKLDTGMSRLGYVVKDDTIDSIVSEISRINDLKNIVIEGMYTHFATADIKNKEFKDLQMYRFNTIVRLLEEKNIRPEIVHCSNSAEILESIERYDMVRPGIIQYGVYPSDEVEHTVDVKPVMTFKTRVTNIKNLEPGVSIGYGRTYFTTVDERIATIAVGYADGFFRGRRHPYVFIKGHKCEVVGRICMDQTMVRIPMDLDLEVGEEVLIFGQEFVSVGQVAKECDSIEHEILCAISKRVKRVYMKNNEIVKIVDYLNGDTNA